MRLRREATFWIAEGEVESMPHASSLLKYIYEPLETHAPQDAEPYCCYLKTVIFYEGRAWGNAAKEITRCDHYDLAAAPSSHLLYIGGTWYEVSSGKVLWRNDRWYYRFTLDARTQRARIANLGVQALRAEYQGDKESGELTDQERKTVISFLEFGIDEKTHCPPEYRSALRKLKASR